MPIDTTALVLGIVNPTTGTGKTTIAVHLARAIQVNGLRSVVMDADPEGAAQDWRGRSPRGYNPPPVVPVIDPSVVRPDVRRLALGYDVVLLDGPSQERDMTRAILSVSDVALIPFHPSTFGFNGTGSFFKRVAERAQRGRLRVACVASWRDPSATLADEMGANRVDCELPVFEGIAQRGSFVQSMREGHTVFDRGDRRAAADVRELLSDVAALLRTPGREEPASCE
jgi:chromosome partitioning protein